MQFSISLEIGGQRYTGKGATPAEALGNLERPPKLMGKGLVTTTDGKTKKQLLMTPAKLKTLFFNSPGIQAVKAKQLFMLTK